MMFRFLTVNLWMVWLLLVPGSVAAAVEGASPFEAALDAAGYDDPQAAAYRLAAFIQPELLPEPLRSLALEEAAAARAAGAWRCGTPMVLEVMRDYDRMTPEIQQLVDEVVGFAPMDPGDSGSTRETEAACNISAPNEQESDHFRVLWGNSYNGAGVDDLIEAMEHARQTWIDLGYREPYGVGVNDWKLPIFIGSSGDGMPTISWSGGYTTVCDDHSGSYIVMSQDIESWSFTADVGPHELYHAIQMGYNNWGMAGWYWEASATWSEDLPYPDLNGYVWFLDTYTSAPEVSLMDESDFNHPYAMFIFPMAIEEFVTDGIEVMRKMWEQSNGDVASAMGAILEADHDTTFDKAFAEFTARVGMMEDFEDGALFGHARRVYTVDSYPDSVEDFADSPPGSYGTNFIDLNEPDTDPPDTKMHFEFDGGGESNWVLGVIKHRAEDGVNKTVEVEVDGDGHAEFDIIDVGTLYDDFVVAISYTGNGGSPPYSWSVEMQEQTEEQGDDDDDDGDDDDSAAPPFGGCGASPYEFEMTEEGPPSMCSIANGSRVLPWSLLVLVGLLLVRRRG